MDGEKSPEVCEHCRKELEMANYHLEVGIISRGKGRSAVKSISYICGEKLQDQYNGRTYYNRRQDVLQYKIFLPDNAPPEFNHLQSLCNAIDKAEHRYDARTAREFKGSLPNELPFLEQFQIVKDYIDNNFVSYDLCAIAAIHEGKNEADPKKNNPHVHIIVPTRSVTLAGFSKKKNREWDKRKYICIWREEWANEQNRDYERNGMDIRVSHESLEVQGKNREPTIHLNRIDFQREKLGERTADEKRAIKARNEERIRQKQLEEERDLEMELSR